MRIVGRHVSKLTGYAPSLPTPFDKHGKVDEHALGLLCYLQVQAGATALVVCGASGESSTLSDTEHDTIIRIAVNVARGQIPVIAGAGSNSTSHAIALSKIAEAAGADALLSVVPYYNKPTQAGIHAHFQAIAQLTALPIILHDVPSRTARGVADDTIARLAYTRQFIGLKDATGDVGRVMRLRARLGTAFRLLSGDDATAFSFLMQGGDGCISVTSNIAPNLCRDMYLAVRQNQTARAQRLATRVARLTESLVLETDPAPLKYALNLLGLMSSKVRLPLVGPDEPTKAAIASAIMDARDHCSDLIAKSCFDAAIERSG